jgi:hypothetical protein
MAVVRVTGGTLNVEAMSGNQPDQGLPPPGYASGQPVPPGYASTQPIPPWHIHGPIDPGYGCGMPPIASGQPVPPGYASGQPVPPTYPVDPGYDLPSPPHLWPAPPRPEQPDQSLPPIPVKPSVPIYLPPEGEEHPLPPGSVWPPLPPSVTGVVMCLVWIVGAGYRWTVIDTGLQPSVPIYPPPLPPYASGQPVPGRPPHGSGQPVPGQPEGPPAVPR